MFMGREEIKNTFLLTKVKSRIQKKYLVFGICVALAILVLNLFIYFKQIEYEFIRPILIRMQDYSVSILIGVLIGFAITSVSYRKESDYFSIYPQTNQSRFLSSKLKNYFLAFFLCLVPFLFYFIQLAVVKVSMRYSDSIVLRLPIDISFLIVGFFTFVVYVYLSISFFMFLGVLLRKFGIYAVTILVVIAALVLFRWEWSVKHLLGFYILESSIPVFFLKGIGTFVLLEVLSFVINAHTIYYNAAGRKIKKMGVISIAFVVLFLVYISLTTILSSQSYQTSLTLVEELGEEYSPTEGVKTFDISGLEKGRLIQVKTNENIAKRGESYTGGMQYIQEEPIWITGDTLRVEYSFPHSIENGVNMESFFHPVFSARLEGYILYLDYEYEKDKKIVELTVWPMASQFEMFKEHATSYFTTSFSSGGGDISVVVES